MRAAIIANGYVKDYAFYRAIVAPSDFIVCANGGARIAVALGLRPQVVIGDLDSLDDSLHAKLQEEGCQLLVYPARKDETDTELAIKYALAQGAQEIIILAALGGRLDHALANVLLLAMPDLDGVRARIVDERQEIVLVKDEVTIEGQVGDLVSLLPLTGDVTGIYTEGLEYALQGGYLRFGLARGISNVMTASQAKVRVEPPGNNLLLAIHVREK
jgi:thiamine pyrophosphokinase